MTIKYHFDVAYAMLASFPLNEPGNEAKPLYVGFPSKNVHYHF